MTMRRLCFALLLALVCQLGFGQTAKEVFREFAREKKSEVSQVPLALALGILLTDEGMEGTAGALLRRAENFEYISLDKCRRRVRRRFAERIGALSDTGYTDFMRLKEGRDDVRALLRQVGTERTELVLLLTGDDDCSAVRVVGRFTTDELTSLVKGMADSD